MEYKHFTTLDQSEELKHLGANQEGEYFWWVYTKCDEITENEKYWFISEEENAYKGINDSKVVTKLARAFHQGDLDDLLPPIVADEEGFEYGLMVVFAGEKTFAAGYVDNEADKQMYISRAKSPLEAKTNLYQRLLTEKVISPQYV